MKLDNLDTPRYKTVFVRKSGILKAKKLIVKGQKPQPQKPMFPIPVIRSKYAEE
jgi:hypothetical protein